MLTRTAGRERALRSLAPHGFHRVVWHEWGDADNPRVVVCVHGLTRTGRDFDVLAEALAATHRVLAVDMERQQVLSSEQQRLEVDAYARFRVIDPVKMVRTAGTTDRVAEQLQPILSSVLRQELGKRTFQSLLTADRGFLLLSWVLVGFIGLAGIVLRRLRVGGPTVLGVQSMILVLFSLALSALFGSELSATSWFARNEPDCQRSASTSVVFP